MSFDSELVVALENDDVDVVSQLLRRSDKPEHLRLLCAAGEHNATRVLMHFAQLRGADVNELGELSTPLGWMVYHGNLEAVNFLLGCRGIQVDLRVKGRRTPLCCAAGEGYPEIVEALLRAGASIDNTSNWDMGMTALYAAADKNRPAALKVLLAKRGDPNLALAGGESPLFAAAHDGSLDVIAQLLADPRTDVNAVRVQDGTPPLTMALSQRQFPAAHLIIDDPRTELNTFDGNGMTPIMMAAFKGNLPTMQRLVEAGADVLLRSKTRSKVRAIECAAKKVNEYEEKAAAATTPEERAQAERECKKHEAVVEYLQEAQRLQEKKTRKEDRARAREAQSAEEKTFRAKQRALASDRGALGVFYQALFRGLSNKFAGYRVLEAGDIQRAGNGVDTAAKGIKLLGDTVSLPLISGAVKAVGAGIGMANDVYQQRKFATIAEVVSRPGMDEEIAAAVLHITESYENSINQLTPEGAKKLAHCATGRIVDFLSADQGSIDEPLAPQFQRALAAFKPSKSLFGEQKVETQDGERLTVDSIFQTAILPSSTSTALTAMSLESMGSSRSTSSGTSSPGGSLSDSSSKNSAAGSYSSSSDDDHSPPRNHLPPRAVTPLPSLAAPAKAAAAPRFSMEEAQKRVERHWAEYERAKQNVFFNKDKARLEARGNLAEPRACCRRATDIPSLLSALNVLTTTRAVSRDKQLLDAVESAYAEISRIASPKSAAGLRA